MRVIRKSFGRCGQPTILFWSSELFFLSDEFAKSFKDNFVDCNSLSNLVDAFACDIKDTMNDDYCDVSSVSEVVKSLNLSKAYDYNFLTVEHIVSAHPAVYMVLKYLLNAIH